MISLTPGQGQWPPATTKHVVFIVRPSLANMDLVAGYVKQEEASGGSGVRTEYHIVFVPRKSLLCEKRLIQKGVFGSLSCHSLPIYLFPLDTDLLSMEIPSSFRDMVDGDMTSLHYAATSLTRLQAVTGVIPRIYGKGSAAKQVFDLMNRMKRESCGRDPQVRSQIDALVLIDRSVDLISPLPTQLTYEGLLDEMIGIQCGSLTLYHPERKVITMTSQEELYQELRGLNFSAVGPTLSQKAKKIKAMADEIRDESITVKKMKQFITSGNLSDIQKMKQPLENHIGLTEIVKSKIDSEEFLTVLELEQRILTGGGEGGRYLDEIEDLVCSNSLPVTRIIRIICLQSVVCSGLKPRVFESYRRLLLESYGYDLLLSLDNLSQAGLFVANTANKRSNYSVLSKRLGIIVENVDEQDPHDIAYVHTVYGPLSVKLVQQLESPGWRNIRDILDMLPGHMFEDAQQVGAGGMFPAGKRNPGQKKVVMVFFVGGVTMAEIAALRFLSLQDDSSVEYMVSTTSIINGNKFIESLYTKLEAPIF